MPSSPAEAALMLLTPVATIVTVESRAPFSAAAGCGGASSKIAAHQPAPVRRSRAPAGKAACAPVPPVSPGRACTLMRPPRRIAACWFQIIRLLPAGGCASKIFISFFLPVGAPGAGDSVAGLPMPMGCAVVAMCAGQIGADEIEIPVPHAALGDQPVRELPHPLDRPLQQHRFQAVLVIDVRMRRGYDQVVVGVLQTRQTLGQLTLVMVVDVRQARGAVPVAVAALPLGLQVAAQDIAHRFAARRIASPLDEPIESPRQPFIQRYREAIHGPLPKRCDGESTSPDAKKTGGGAFPTAGASGAQSARAHFAPAHRERGAPLRPGAADARAHTRHAVPAAWTAA